jgi:hypothetical protein
VIFWLPLAAVLLSPLPVTTTAVAFALVHEIVVDPGATTELGEALIEALTAEAGATVTVAL